MCSGRRFSFPFRGSIMDIFNAAQHASIRLFILRRNSLLGSLENVDVLVGREENRNLVFVRSSASRRAVKRGASRSRVTVGGGKIFFPVCSEGKFYFDVFFFRLTLQYVEGECDCTIEENSHFFCLHHQKSSCTWLRRSLLREFFRRCPLVPFIRNVVTLTTASDSVIASDTRRRHKLFTRAIFLSFLLYQKKKRRQNNLKSSLSRNLIHVWSVHATISSIYLPMKINTPPNIQSWLSPSNELIDVFFSLL